MKRSLLILICALLFGNFGAAKQNFKAPEAGRPVVIGISRNGMPEVNRENFAKCIHDAGAEVFFFPSYPETDSLINDYLDRIDCLIIPGSATNDTVGRKKYDAHIIRTAVERGMPLLGICEGHQRINQTLGGVMDKIEYHYPGCTDSHRIYEDGKNVGALMEAHPIYIDKNSTLYKIFGTDTLMVNTSHSWCTPVISDKLKVVAVAPDGIVEAYEGDNIMGLQWHPEYLYGKMGIEKFLKVFEWFAGEGQRYRDAKENALSSSRNYHSDFNTIQLIAPCTLMAAGTAIHFWAHDAVDLKLNGYTSTWRGDSKKTVIDDYARFIPQVMHLGLGLCGATAEHCFIDRGIEMCWTWASVAAVGYSVKPFVDSPRPDGSDNRSFPSGHSVLAFSGAELVRMEYGNGWGAGAYAVAAGVSALRLYDNEHWVSDLIFGAGAGILCAHIGGWMLKPTRKLISPVAHKLGADHISLSIQPAADPVYGLAGASVAILF